MKYFFIGTLGDQSDIGLCILDHVPEGIGVHYYCMMEGAPIGDKYPTNAKINMSQDRAGIKLDSLIGNVKSYLIVHREVKEIIEVNYTNEIEYLPFTLINHKGRAHSKDYFIVNPIGSFDCLNHSASDIDYFEGKKGRKVLAVNRFVINPEKARKAPWLFRIKEDPTEYVINESLAKAFKDKNFSNIVLTEIQQKEE